MALPFGSPIPRKAPRDVVTRLGALLCGPSRSRLLPRNNLGLITPAKKRYCTVSHAAICPMDCGGYALASSGKLEPVFSLILSPAIPEFARSGGKGPGIEDHGCSPRSIKVLT